MGIAEGSKLGVSEGIFEGKDCGGKDGEGDGIMVSSTPSSLLTLHVSDIKITH